MNALMKYLWVLVLILFTLVMVMESKTGKSLLGPLGESLRIMTAAFGKRFYKHVQQLQGKGKLGLIDAKNAITQVLDYDNHLAALSAGPILQAKYFNN